MSRTLTLLSLLLALTACAERPNSLRFVHAKPHNSPAVAKQQDQSCVAFVGHRGQVPKQTSASVAATLLTSGVLGLAADSYTRHMANRVRALRMEQCYRSLGYVLAYLTPEEAANLAKLKHSEQRVPFLNSVMENQRASYGLEASDYKKFEEVAQRFPGLWVGENKKAGVSVRLLVTGWNLSADIKCNKGDSRHVIGLISWNGAMEAATIHNPETTVLSGVVPNLKVVEFSECPASAVSVKREEMAQKSANTGMQEDPAAHVGEPLLIGSGFFINDKGDLLTTYRLAQGCQKFELSGKGGASKASVYRVDKRNNIALLRAERGSTPFAHFSASEIAKGTNVTLRGSDDEVDTLSLKGSLSEVTGPNKDKRFIGVTTKESDGDSGGPVIDSTGSVVGLAVSELAVSKMSGDFAEPQTRYAIRASVLKQFLDANNIQYHTGINSSGQTPFVVRVRCESRTAAIK